MTVGIITTLMQDSVRQILTMALPFLIVSLVVGLVVSILQAITSIQEQTLTFLPKMIAIFVALALLSSWLLTNTRDWTIRIFEMIPQVAQ